MIVKNRKFRNLEHRNRRRICYESVNRETYVIIPPSLILTLQASFDTICFRAVDMVLERLF